MRPLPPYDASGHRLADNAPGASTWLEFLVKPGPGGLRSTHVPALQAFRR